MLDWWRFRACVMEEWDGSWALGTEVEIGDGTLQTQIFRQLLSDSKQRVCPSVRPLHLL